MSALWALAPAKVNLCLFLGARRADGLHELVSVVEPLSLADVLELGPAPDGVGADEVICPGVEGPNLAAAALAAFRQASGWDAPPRRLTVRKRVPVAGGMGGGSADAAATLRLAAAAAGTGRSFDLHDLARRLGSDVPALLRPQPALVTAAGEEVRPVPALEPHWVLVLPSPQRLPTPAVFAEADRLGLPRAPDDLAARRDEVERTLARGRLAASVMVNDLEPAALSLCPGVAPALRAAREAGADHALVSGSGPTVVGLFTTAEARERAQAAVDELSSRFAGACVAAPVDPALAVPRPLETAT